MSKTFLLALAIVMFMVGGLVPAHADTVSARVLGSQEITEQVPIYGCHGDQAKTGSPTWAALGALAGGLLGHTVGGGTGNLVATAGGAATGAVIGDRYGNSNNGQDCHEIVGYKQISHGYDVQIEVPAHTLTVHTNHAPGSTLPVEVGAAN